MKNWKIGPAQKSDGLQLANLFRSIQTPQRLPCTIWSSHSVHAFVDDVIEGANSEMKMKFYVIRNAEKIGGAICIRTVEGRLFFDNLIVLPEVRAHQLAIWFIVESIRMHVSHVDYEEFAFDVYANERVLVTWYRRLGGKEQYRKHWFCAPLPDTTSAEVGDVCESAQAAEKQKRYGFSMIDVFTRRSRYRVGRLAGHGYRLPDEAAYRDPQLLATLRANDSGRLVYFPSANPVAPAPAELVSSSIRMHAQKERFLASLEKQLPIKVQDS